MRTTHVITISLPPALVRQFDAVRKSESRTRSELVREALRAYFERRFPLEKATKAEIAAIRRGREAFRRGDYVTLDQFHAELDARRHKTSKKRVGKISQA